MNKLVLCESTLDYFSTRRKKADRRLSHSEISLAAFQTCFTTMTPDKSLWSFEGPKIFLLNHTAADTTIMYILNRSLISRYASRASSLSIAREGKESQEWGWKTRNKDCSGGWASLGVPVDSTIKLVAQEKAHRYSSKVLHFLLYLL